MLVVGRRVGLGWAGAPGKSWLVLVGFEYLPTTLLETMPREIEKNLPATNEGYGTKEYWCVLASLGG